MLVIGGAHSNNTRELVATCAPFCPRIHHIQTVEDFHDDWVAGAETVGITAGTSTPDETIEAVERHLLALATESSASSVESSRPPANHEPVLVAQTA